MLQVAALLGALVLAAAQDGPVILSNKFASITDWGTEGFSQTAYTSEGGG